MNVLGQIKDCFFALVKLQEAEASRLKALDTHTRLPHALPTVHIKSFTEEKTKKNMLRNIIKFVLENKY